MPSNRKIVPTKDSVEMSHARKEQALAIAQMSATQHISPIPDAAHLARYEKVLPGAADRIITISENQSKHRQELEKLAITGRRRDSLLGIIFSV